MTPEERQQYFDREGYWPVEFVERKVSPREQADRLAHQLQLSTRSSMLRGWKAPLHWTVPAAFDKPGRIYEALRHELGEQEGHEAFLAQVQEYYSAIREMHVQQAQRWHVRWAIKQILRAFETQVRGFRGQSVGRNGSIFGRGSGQEHNKRSNTYSDILVLPETLAKDGRLVHDLVDYMRAYGVPKAEEEASIRLVKAKLQSTWGVKL